MLVIGLMSGTSLDGIDAALVRFAGDDAAPDWRLVAFEATPYSAAQRRQVQEAIAGGGTDALCRLHADLGEWFAAAARAVCRTADVPPESVDLIGSHGQTVWHEPERCATLQLGSAAVIAERTGIPVVHDFRARDVAAGGEGAPLVPWADRLLFAVPGRRRALQNIGGMANVSLVPAAETDEPLLAFDTGPGMAAINAAVELATGGGESYDRDGRMAADGRVDDGLLERLLEHPFFRTAPPKSTGREAFGRRFVEDIVERERPGSPERWADLVATLTALTARSIADAYRRWITPRGVDEVIVTGGGSHNPVLMRMLEDALAPLPLRRGEAAGIDVDAKEAVAFAALAWAYARGRPANVPEATGASGPRLLGSFTPGGRNRPSESRK